MTMKLFRIKLSGANAYMHACLRLLIDLTNNFIFVFLVIKTDLLL